MDVCASVRERLDVGTPTHGLGECVALKRTWVAA